MDQRLRNHLISSSAHFSFKATQREVEIIAEILNMGKISSEERVFLWHWCCALNSCKSRNTYIPILYDIHTGVGWGIANSCFDIQTVWHTLCRMGKFLALVTYITQCTLLTVWISYLRREWSRDKDFKNYSLIGVILQQAFPSENRSELRILLSVGNLLIRRRISAQLH